VVAPKLYKLCAMCHQSVKNRTFTDPCNNVTLLLPLLVDIVDRTPMATRSFVADDQRNGVQPVDRPISSAAGIHRYRLNVIASSMTDVVQSAGGWLFDRSRAGWDVNVLVAEHGDPRPLAILGATASDLDAGFSAMVRNVAQGGALAVGADVLGTDVRIREEVVKLLKSALTEVTVWGDAWPAELGRQLDPVPHRVSSAARAFKFYALAAASVSGDAVSRNETLFRIGTGTFRPLYSV
jgi:hypothetical protein